MALRAVSIVNLESSIRADFDRQYDTIQRNLQAQNERRRSSQPPARNNDEENSNPESTENSQSPEEMTENGDLGCADSLSVPSATHHGSMDISVECPNFPTSPDLPERDDDSDSIDLDREIEDLSTDNRRHMTCCQFYRNHWIGHLVTAILSGFLFVLLGVIFLVNGEQFPVYAGITLILLGLAPCCMALNRYRYMRLYDRERRRAVRRLGALRRLHRRNVRDNRRQEFPDLPPAYDNLGYDLSGEDFEIVIDDSRRSSFVLPTYDQCVKKKISTEAKEPITSDVTSVDDVIANHLNNNYNDNNNNMNSESHQEPEVLPASDIQIEITPPNENEDFVVIDNVSQYNSTASSSGEENDNIDDGQLTADETPNNSDNETTRV
ncbi:uncharacterized protein LOC120347405 [Styela clava]